MNKRDLFVENLTPRLLMAIDVAEVEPNNTESQANRFQLPAAETVVLRGNSTNQDDKDYFAFTANASGPIAVAVSSTAGAKLEISNQSGADLFETEPKDGVNSGSFQAIAGTTYLLRMRAPDKAAASYAVSLSATGSTGNPSNPGAGTGGSTGGAGNGNSGSTVVETEPNDNASQALQLTLVSNEPRTLSGAAGKKDRDFFVVTPTSSGTVNIDTGNALVKVSIETPQGAKLFESAPNDGVFQGTISVAEGQTFVLRTRGLSSSPTAYSISVTLNGTPAANAGTTASSVTRTVPIQWLDASDDGVVSPLDALLVINHLSRRHQAAHDAVMLQFDMNDDSRVSPIDALLVINYISNRNRNRSRGTDDLRPEGESNHRVLQTASSDDVFETELHRNRRRGR